MFLSKNYGKPCKKKHHICFFATHTGLISHVDRWKSTHLPTNRESWVGHVLPTLGRCRLGPIYFVIYKKTQLTPSHSEKCNPAATQIGQSGVMIRSVWSDDSVSLEWLFSRHFFWNTLVRTKWDGGRIKVILTDPATGHSDGISCQRDPRSQGSSWCLLKKTSNFKLLATQDCSDFFSVTWSWSSSHHACRWTVHKCPYNGLLQSPNNWVV